MTTTLARLQQQYAELPVDIDIDFRIRLRRALSWIASAETYQQDIDMAFIALWVAFNACYAVSGADKYTKTRNLYEHFFRKLVKHDKERLLWQSVCCQQAQAIAILVQSKYTFSPYWNAKKDASINWQQRLEKTQVFVQSALKNQDVEAMLSVVFDRLYVLRNQIMHGGAAHGVDYNRKMLGAGHAVLDSMMPIIVALMLKHHQADWGEVYFPVNQQKDHSAMVGSI